MVLMPDTAEVRADSWTRIDERTFELAMQGAGDVCLSVAATRKITRATIVGDQGQPQLLQIDRVGGDTRLALSLSGAHVLRLECNE